jgi:hypothetical protein
MVNMEEYLANPIKRHIIGLLLRDSQLKYSELMPAEVDNVLFNYHLQHLVKNGVLTKNENNYSLSPEGIKLTSNVTYDGVYFPKFTCRYKLYLIDGNNILLPVRTNTAWYGDIAAVSSKLLYGTPTEERANVRMRDKVGVEAKMNWIGTLRTQIFDKQHDLLDDSIYFVCFADSHSGEINKVDDHDLELRWHSFEEALEVEKKSRASGDKSLEVLQRIQAKNYQPFCFEETVIIDTP